MSYRIHTAETAPQEARDSLAAATKAYGFCPNLLAVMAEAPALLKAYLTIARLFEETSLTPAERQVVLLTVSYENGCEYCVAAHTVIAHMQRVPRDVVEAIREGKSIADKKLEALRRYTAALVQSRGWPSAEDSQAFFDAGYTQANVLEVVLGVGQKTLSNYTNHIASTPLDQAFAKAAWSTADVERVTT